MKGARFINEFRVFVESSGQFLVLKGRQIELFQGHFAFLPGSKSDTNDGWQEHRNAGGAFGIRILLMASAPSLLCAGFSVIRRHA
jgi:hypothetical protein